jgi:hypothetical protein
MITHQTICTKYLPPDGALPARIITATYGRNKVMQYQYSLDLKANHANGAHGLADLLGWKGRLIRGQISKGFVFLLME